MGNEIRITFKPEIFNQVYMPYFKNTDRHLHLYGSANSGKSVFAAQKLLIRTLIEPEHRFLVIRKTFRTHRHSTFQLFLNLISKYGLESLFKINKTTLSISCPTNKGEIIFAGVDDVEKLKSFVDITGEWIEEATELTYDEVMQINVRMRGQTKYYKQLVYTYNPVNIYHWLNTKIHEPHAINPLPDTTVLKTTYQDNKFCSPDDYKVMDAIRQSDPIFWQIYGLGMWAAIKGLIYNGWEINAQEPERYDDVVYGIDFGFTNSPTALVAIYKRGDELSFKELIYQTKLLNSDIARMLKEFGVGSKPIYCDSAEPKSIEELYSAGFNVHPAEKDVKAGIDYVKNFKCHIISGSENLTKEYQSYKWKEDKNGVMLNEPVKFLDHALDAVRYGCFTHGRKYWQSKAIFIPGGGSSKTGGGSRFSQPKKISSF